MKPSHPTPCAGWRVRQARPGGWRRVALGLVAGVVAGLASAAPFVPASDADIVETLPARITGEQRRQRAQLAAQPQQLPLAMSVARAALQRARAEGDPRELGHAQAALAPWWSKPDPPAAVRLLRATVWQSQHRFDRALVDLSTLGDAIDQPPAIQAQALLTQASVLQVLGRFDEAAAACTRLLQPRLAALGPAVIRPARACVAEIRSLQGEPRAAAAALAQLAREAPDDAWLALVRAELAQRLGLTAQAENLFGLALREGGDVYARAAYADLLLEQARWREALELIDSGPARADALRLRRLIALRGLGDPAVATLAAELQADFDGARVRGDLPHLREEARLALDVRGDASTAWRLAQLNWAVQKEPADARLLWRSALAATQADKARELLQRWSPHPERVDLQLAPRTLAKERMAGGPLRATGRRS